MAKSKPTRREFDWRTYTKPARLLTPEQEQALTRGVLGPVAEWASRHESVRFEIRARQAALYDRGTLLLRIRGNEPPFVGEIDANVRLPRDERSGAERIEVWPLSTPDEVSAILDELDSLAAFNDAVTNAPPERSALHTFASANDGRAGDRAVYIVADTEYQYGRRRFDFVAMRRAEGVGGLAAFTTPRLVFGQFKSAERPLSGSSGLVGHAADFAEFALSLGGSHLTSARLELDELVRQKVRLGLLDASIPFRHFTDDRPEYLVVLSGFDLSSPELDGTLAEMHDRLVARHYPPDLLRLASVAPSDTPESRRGLEVAADVAMEYRAFKRIRKQARAQRAQT